MCHEHGHHRGGHERGFRGGFGRRGFPSRDEWLERLEAHRERLEQDLANVRDLIQRLQGDAPGPAPS